MGGAALGALAGLAGGFLLEEMREHACQLEVEAFIDGPSGGFLSGVGSNFLGGGW